MRDDRGAVIAHGRALLELAAELERGTLVREPPALTNVRDPRFGELEDAHPGAHRRVRHWRHRFFDLWHEVPLVPQLTGMSCWAAAAAMVVGWRDQLDVEPDHIARGLGGWRAYRDGLLPGDVHSLAAAWGLQTEPPRRYDVDALRALLERHGPLWLGEADPGLHVIVIAGIHGEGAPENTFVRVNDPWPVGLGERYTLSVERLVENFDSARDLAGLHAQILHAGGRGAAGHSRYHVHSSCETTVVTRGVAATHDPRGDSYYQR